MEFKEVNLPYTFFPPRIVTDPYSFFHRVVWNSLDESRLLRGVAENTANRRRRLGKRTKSTWKTYLLRMISRESPLTPLRTKSVSFLFFVFFLNFNSTPLSCPCDLPTNLNASKGLQIHITLRLDDINWIVIHTGVSCHDNRWGNFRMSTQL